MAGSERIYERIYIAGPYSAETENEIVAHVEVATKHAAIVMALGHDVFCPHAMSRPIDLHIRTNRFPDATFAYERWMRMCFGMIENWATGLLYTAPSPGSDRELALAEHLGRAIYRNTGEVRLVV